MPDADGLLPHARAFAKNIELFTGSTELGASGRIFHQVVRRMGLLRSLGFRLNGF